MYKVLACGILTAVFLAPAAAQQGEELQPAPSRPTKPQRADCRLHCRVSGPHNGIATHPAEKLARTDRRCFNNLHASFLGDGSCGLVCDLHKGGASLNRSNGFSKLVLKDLFQPFV